MPKQPPNAFVPTYGALLSRENQKQKTAIGRATTSRMPPKVVRKTNGRSTRLVAQQPTESKQSMPNHSKSLAIKTAKPLQVLILFPGTSTKSEDFEKNAGVDKLPKETIVHTFDGIGTSAHQKKMNRLEGGISKSIRYSRPAAFLLGYSKADLKVKVLECLQFLTSLNSQNRPIELTTVSHSRGLYAMEALLETLLKLQKNPQNIATLPAIQSIAIGIVEGVPGLFQNAALFGQTRDIADLIRDLKTKFKKVQTAVYNSRYDPLSGLKLDSRIPDYVDKKHSPDGPDIYFTAGFNHSPFEFSYGRSIYGEHNPNSLARLLIQVLLGYKSEKDLKHACRKVAETERALLEKSKNATYDDILNHNTEQFDSLSSTAYLYSWPVALTTGARCLARDLKRANKKCKKKDKNDSCKVVIHGRKL